MNKEDYKKYKEILLEAEGKIISARNIAPHDEEKAFDYLSEAGNLLLYGARSYLDV